MSNLTKETTQQDRMLLNDQYTGDMDEGMGHLVIPLKFWDFIKHLVINCWAFIELLYFYYRNKEIWYNMLGLKVY